VTLYEMNQAGYASLPKMAKSAISAAEDKVADWIQASLSEHGGENIYFMLLNNDLHYYTLFNWRALSPKEGGGDSEDVVREIFSIVKSLGTLKAIEKNNNDAWEFWITKPNATTDAYYLFDYTKGVIEV